MKIKHILLLLPFITLNAVAEQASDLSSMVGQLQSQIATVVNLFGAVAFVAGIGFLLAGILKFKNFRDNPQQVPLSAPITYLIIGSLLVFLPSLVKIGGETMGVSSRADADDAWGNN